MTDYKKLARQPLQFALAEFRFSPILRMEEYIPELQDALRAEFPLPESTQEQSVQVQPGGIAMLALTRWGFLAAERKSGLAIDQNRLIYFTTEYLRFDGFSESCRNILSTLENIVKPALVLRIGLRYGDLIKIPKDEVLTDYVDEYLGFSTSVKALGTPIHQRNEVAVRTSIGVLIIRSIFGETDLVCMPDLMGIPLSLEKDKKPSQRIVLDFDHYLESGNGSLKFESDQAIGLLSQLHLTSREAFWQITTNEAREQKWS